MKSDSQDHVAFLSVSRSHGIFDRTKSDVKEIPLKLIEFVEKVMSFIAKKYEFSAINFFSKKLMRDERICEAKDLVYKMLREKTNCDWRLIARLLWMEKISEINHAQHRHDEKAHYPKEYREYMSCFRQLRAHFSSTKKIILKTSGTGFIIDNSRPHLEQKMYRMKIA